MGLDCSHDAWHGAYSAFMRWRQKLAEVAGLPPLELMEGFFDSKPYGTLFFGQQDGGGVWGEKRARLQEGLPIKWGCLKPSALYELLYHSDCDGDIQPDRCGPIADELEKLIPLLPDEEAGGHIGNWREKPPISLLAFAPPLPRMSPLIFIDADTAQTRMQTRRWWPECKATLSA